MMSSGEPLATRHSLTRTLVFDFEAEKASQGGCNRDVAAILAAEQPVVLQRRHGEAKRHVECLVVHGDIAGLDPALITDCQPINPVGSWR